MTMPTLTALAQARFLPGKAVLATGTGVDIRNRSLK